jgi:membrane associated rhomboid family serine protease
MMDLDAEAEERRAARARANFRLALILSLGFVGLLFLLQLTSFALDVDVDDLGVRPRRWIGLVGILFAPLLHSGFGHFFSNAPALVVMGTAMLYLYPASARIVLPAVYFGPGIAVWLLGRDSSHLGSSGVLYGLFAYVLTAGLLRRDRRALSASLLVVFLYGASIWGVLPLQPSVSWETHLAAALIGVACALALRHRDVVPPRRYSWEDEADPGRDDTEVPWWNDDDRDGRPPIPGGEPSTRSPSAFSR